jgi:hypothetical protein
VLAARGHEIAFVFPDEVRAGVLEAFDVFVIPGGARRSMIGELEPLGSAGARAVVSFVEAGGMYTSSCAGSYCAADVGPEFRALCPVKNDLDLCDVRVFNEDPAYPLSLRSPGVGVVRLRNVAPRHPVMADMPEVFEIVHYNGPLFCGGGTPLAVVDGPEAAFTPGLQRINPDVDDDLLDRAAAERVASIVITDRGAGRVLLFGSHPEFGVRPAMDDELGAARLLHNAVQWQASMTERQSNPRPALAMDAEPAESHDQLVEKARELADAVRAGAEAIGAREPTAWLERRRALSLFGREPTEVFEGALADIDRLATEVAEMVPAVPSQILGFRPRQTYDAGYTGVLALLEMALAQIRLADAEWSADVGPDPADAYDNLDRSPYHLVAGSYLAAVGNVGSAALLSRSYAVVAVQA